MMSVFVCVRARARACVLYRLYAALPHLLQYQLTCPPLYFFQIKLNVILLSASRPLQTVQISTIISDYDKCYIPFPSQPRFGCLNTIWHGTQIVKLLITGLHLYKVSCHFQPFISKYSAENPLFSKNFTRGSMCSYLKLVDRLSHPCKTAAEVTVLLILISKDLRLLTADEETKIMNWNAVSTYRTRCACSFFENETVPRCRPCFPAMSSLATFSVVIFRRYWFFFLPALQCAKDSVFGHRPVRLSFEILLSAWGSKTRFGFSDCGPRGSCWCWPELWFFLFLVD